MFAKQVAIGLATLSLCLCVAGAALSARVIVSNTGRLDVIYLWTILPMWLATFVFVQVLRSGRAWSVWAATGALSGFVIAALMSFGVFYFYGAIVLIAAAVAHLIARGQGRRIVLACVWFIAGVTSLGPLFLLIGWIRELNSPAIVHDTAPSLVVYASGTFLVTIAALVVWHEVQRYRVRYRS